MFKIRPETEADCATVAALHVLAWQVGYRGMLPDEMLDSLDVSEWTQRRLQRLGHSLVAERNAEIVGFISFGPGRQDESVGEIYACYLHPDHWGCGAADQLIRVALDELSPREVYLWVLEENERALRFYARHGLAPDGVRDFYHGAPEVRCSLKRE